METLQKNWNGYFTIRKVDFRKRSIMRATEGHFLIRIESVQQEDMPFLNVYIPNYGVSKQETKT